MTPLKESKDSLSQRPVFATKSRITPKKKNPIFGVPVQRACICMSTYGWWEERWATRSLQSKTKYRAWPILSQKSIHGERIHTKRISCFLSHKCVCFFCRHSENTHSFVSAKKGNETARFSNKFNVTKRGLFCGCFFPLRELIAEEN